MIVLYIFQCSTKKKISKSFLCSSGCLNSDLRINSIKARSLSTPLNKRKCKNRGIIYSQWMAGKSESTKFKELSL